jgi:hypothetical protein
MKTGFYPNFPGLTPSPPTHGGEGWGEEAFLLSTSCRDEVKRRRINSKPSQLPSIQVNPTQSDRIKPNQTIFKNFMAGTTSAARSM